MNNTDNSSTGVILGIILAVAIAIGAYYFIKSEGGMKGGDTTNIVMPETKAPDVAPSSGSSTTP